MFPETVSIECKSPYLEVPVIWVVHGAASKYHLCHDANDSPSSCHVDPCLPSLEAP